MMSAVAVDEFTSLEAWRATLAEFVATLLFVFIGAGSVVATGALTNGELTAARLLVIALAHGFAIAILAYATANISGGHINPAVTFAAWLTKNISTARAMMFVLAQLVGAVAGALLLLAAIPDAADTNLRAHALGPGVSIGTGFVMGLVVTFALVFVIFATAVDSGGMGNLAPLAIGLTVLVDHLLAVSITGASMNPARSFGPALVAWEWADHWIYWIAPLAGGVLAGLVYQFSFINRPR